jgi:hypothetical protein
MVQEICLPKVQCYININSTWLSGIVRNKKVTYILPISGGRSVDMIKREIIIQFSMALLIVIMFPR